MAKPPRGLPDLGADPYGRGARIHAGTIMTDAYGVDHIVLADDKTASKFAYRWQQVHYLTRRQMVDNDRVRRACKTRALIFYFLTLFATMLSTMVLPSLWFIGLPIALVLLLVAVVSHRQYRSMKDAMRWARLDRSSK